MTSALQTRGRPWLVLGFGPFGEVADNPASRVAAALEGREVSGSPTAARVLPVSFARAPREAAAALEALRPRATVALGVARGAEIRLEGEAVNRITSTLPDVDGDTREGEPLAPDAPPRLASPLPLQTWAEALDASARALSDDAPRVGFSTDCGGYVCNALYHHLLRSAPPARALFVHLPPRLDATALTAAEAVVLSLFERLAAEGA